MISPSETCASAACAQDCGDDVGQLRAMPAEVLLELPGVGPKAIADIAKLLADQTLRAGDPLWCVAPLATWVTLRANEESIRVRARERARRIDVDPHGPTDLVPIAGTQGPGATRRRGLGAWL